jgi:Ca2+-binding RTX toxin-like protein
MPSGNGNPKIVGGVWGEYVFGTTDSDMIDGRGGADTINGYCGNDTLTGGSGADLFCMDRTYQFWGGGHDLITDFNTSANGHDSLSFSGWGAFATAPSGHLQAGEVLTTVDGYTLTVSATQAGGTLLQWSTGDSFELRGVSPASVDASWIVSA